MTLTEKIPLFPLPVVLFPGNLLPLHIFEPRYRTMVSECLDESKPFGVVVAEGDTVRPVGCTASIVNVLKHHPDGRMDIMTSGRRRFRIHSYDTSRSYLQGTVEYFDDEPIDDEGAIEVLSQDVIRLYRELSHVSLPDESASPCEELSESAKSNGKFKAGNGKPRGASFCIASALALPLEFRRQLLESTCEQQRLTMLKGILEKALGSDGSGCGSQWFTAN